MLYKKNKKELNDELFGNPSSEYRGTPFWAWNCEVTEEKIDKQIEVFHEMGFGGIHIHPRTGMETPYLQDDFMHLVTYADKKVKTENMLCWLYDEDRYPSGTAGGKVTEDVRYRARHLLLTTEIKPELENSKETFDLRVAKGEKPGGYYLCAYRIKIEKGYLTAYRQILGPQPSTDCDRVSKSEGTLWFAYVELMKESPWFNDQTYVDVMNKEAVECFIKVTHERYYEVLSDEFGKSIPAIFTDEPQVKGSMALSDGGCTEDVTLSFTDDLPKTYKNAYGIDLLCVLPEILFELPGGVPSLHRLQYHDHLCERFVSAYSDTIADWCEAHHIYMTGHYMSEPTLYSQTLRLGEAMRCYRKQQLPGVDILCNDPEYSTIKQASSVAHQYGREGVLSELYGVTQWDHDFKGHKIQGDWQAALGVTVRVPHLAFMSMEGEAKRDWPASINYQSPWWEQYSYIENYFARLNTVLTRGTARVKVAVIHPIESYWLAYGPVGQTGMLREQMDENFKNMISWLLFGLIDFDFLSESLLAEQDCFAGEDGTLRIGKMRYEAVIVPELLTVRSTTLHLAEKFAACGGKLIFMGKVPSYVDAEENISVSRLTQKACQISYEKNALLSAMEPMREVGVYHQNGKAFDNLFYQMRQEGEARWLFICHALDQKEKADQSETACVKIRGIWKVFVYNALDGHICMEKPDYQEGWTLIDKEMYAEDSYLWKLEPYEDKEAEIYKNIESYKKIEIWKEESDFHNIRTGKCAETYNLVAEKKYEGKNSKQHLLCTIHEPDAYTLDEPNVFLLDHARWRLNDGEWMPDEEILRLDNKIRMILGYPPRQDAYIQPWRLGMVPEKERVTLYYEIESAIGLPAISMAVERPEKSVLFWNEKPCTVDKTGAYYVDEGIRVVNLPELKKGINTLRIEIPFGRKTNLESIYLLGDFGVWVRGTKAVIVDREEQLCFGDITRQTLPFYGGSVIYHMHFTLKEDADISVRIPHFAAPVLSLAIDDKMIGPVAFAPHIHHAGVLKAGIHKLDIKVYGNRYNTFGTLHNCNPEFKWYGPDSYRTNGSEWSEAWCLRPFGILSRVEILAGN